MSEQVYNEGFEKGVAYERARVLNILKQEIEKTMYPSLSLQRVDKKVNGDTLND